MSLLVVFGGAGVPGLPQDAAAGSAVLLAADVTVSTGSPIPAAVGRVRLADDTVAAVQFDPRSWGQANWPLAPDQISARGRVRVPKPDPYAASLF